MARAFYRSYRSKKFAGRQGECGTTGWGVRRSEPVILDPMPSTPPPGLSWCPGCVGRLAERAGVLGRVAAEPASGGAR